MLPAEPSTLPVRTGWRDLPVLRLFGMRGRGRLLRISAAIAVVVGLATIATWWPLAWVNLDGDRTLQASRVFLDGGDPYSVAGYLYSPFGPILTAPLTILPLGLALLFLVKVDVVAGYTWIRFGPLLALAVLVAPPVVSDLVLGNVNLLLIAAAMWVVNRNELLPGIVFGVLFAAFPKPMVIPLILWFLVFRRRATVGWIAGLGASTAIALLIAGPGLYGEFVRLLLNGGDVGSHFVGNAGLGFDNPMAGLIIGVAVIGVFLVSLRTCDAATSAVVAAGAGMLVGTYQPLYSAELLLAVLPLYHAAHPGRAPFVFAAVFGSIVSLPLAAIASLVVVLVPGFGHGPLVDRFVTRSGPAAGAAEGPGGAP